MIRFCILVCAAAILGQLDTLAPRLPGARARGLSGPQATWLPGSEVLRFHHLHLEVADPASAMNALAEKVQGTRTILQGFGVGVRSGDQYVLFDRADDDPKRAIVTPGYKGRLFGAPPLLVEGPAETLVDGVRVRVVDADLAAGKPGCLQFALFDAASDAPITDLEPFLGAPVHLLIVKPDLTEAIHGHPGEQATGGPTVSFDPRMPAPGLYKLWVQFQRKGTVSTAAFVVAAR